MTVSVHEADAMSLPGGTSVCTLDKSSWGGTGIKRFGADGCVNLTASKLHFVVMDYDDSGGNPFYVNLTQSDSEDTSAPGWNIANVAHLRYETGSNLNWQESQTGRSIQITVRAANTPPTVTNTPTDPLTVTTKEDTDYPFKATDFNFSDADSNDELASVKIATLPTAGTLTLSDNAVNANDDVTANDIGNLKYTPVANANGTPYATVGFTVGDGLHDSASATMTINVTAVNDAPEVSGPITPPSVAENTPSNVTLGTYTATDQENDSLTWSLGKTLSSEVDDSNEFTIVNGELFFAASRDFEDTKDTDKDNVYEVRVQASDGDLGGLDVTITVTDVEVAAEDDTATTDEDMEVVIDVVANDTDDPDEPDDPGTLGVSEVRTPAKGTVAYTPAGTTIAYTPTADFHGTDTFTYTVSNDQEQEATGTVTVTVNAVNDAPVAEADTPTTNEDQAVVIRVLENDTDVDGDTLTVTDVGTPTKGTAEIKDNSTITYTPTAGYTGEDNFYYEISDGNVTSRSRVTVTVTKNADLSSLAITGGSLTPTFVAETSSYAVEVAHSVSSVTVTPITSAAIATVMVNGTPVDSGDSFEFALPGGAGQSTITVAVTNETYTKTYIIEIRRRSAPPDVTRPRVEIQTEAAAPVAGPFEVTITFSEPVEGFEREDIQVSNGMVADFTEVSSSEYRATIKPAEVGQPVVVEVPADVAEDGAGNGNRAAEAFEVETKLVV